MAYTLFDATLDLARVLEDVFESTATGGSTTTVIDTAIVEPTGYYNNGPVWLKEQAATRRVTTHTTTTLTFTPAATAISAGKLYAVGSRYPMRVLIQALNAALKDFGKIPATAEITATAEQQEYVTADNAAFTEEIVKVELAENEEAPYDWHEHYNWQQSRTLPRVFVFDPDKQPMEARKMRLTYLAEHAALSTDASAISDHIHPDRLKWAAAVHALRWRYQRTKQDEPAVIDLLNEAKQQAQAMATKHPLPAFVRLHLARW